MRGRSPAFRTSSWCATISHSSSIVAGESILAADNTDKKSDLRSASSAAKFDGKHSAAVGFVGGGERAAVLSDDAVRECESDAVTFRFGRKEWNKDFL